VLGGDIGGSAAAAMFPVFTHVHRRHFRLGEV
jgi:hypothetical protein